MNGNHPDLGSKWPIALHRERDSQGPDTMVLGFPAAHSLCPHPQAKKAISFAALSCSHFEFLISAIEGWRGFQSSLRQFDRQFDCREL